jgi:hypothetical protein
MKRPATSDGERLSRIEATQDAMLDAVEKINNTLRRFRDTFNHQCAVLDATNEAVAVLQENEKVLAHDIAGLYGQ